MRYDLTGAVSEPLVVEFHANFTELQFTSVMNRFFGDCGRADKTNTQ